MLELMREWINERGGVTNAFGFCKESRYILSDEMYVILINFRPTFFIDLLNAFSGGFEKSLALDTHNYINDYFE